MGKLFQNKIFNLGFSCGVILFVLVNYLTYVKSYYAFTKHQIGGAYSAGFPFIFYRAEAGYPNHFYFISFGLVADILIGVIFSLIIGLLAKFVWSKISSRRMK